MKQVNTILQALDKARMQLTAYGENNTTYIRDAIICVGQIADTLDMIKSKADTMSKVIKEVK